MNFNFDFRFFLQSISAVLSIIMIVYSLLKSKKTLLLYSYILCHAIIFIWSIGQMFEMSSTNVHARFIFIAFEYLAVCFIGFSWLMLCMIYTERKIITNIKSFIPLLALPCFFYFSLLTNQYHHLFFSTFGIGKGNTSFGILFWLLVIMTYIYLSAGAAILLKYSASHFGYARKQSMALIIAMLCPYISNVAYFINSLSNNKFFNTEFDATPVSFCISLMILAIAVFKYRFLNIAPIAFRKIVQDLSESIVVVDSFNKINNFNQSFLDTFKSPEPIKIYDNINKLIKYLKSNMAYTPETEAILNAMRHEVSSTVSGEIKMIHPEKKSYQVNIKPIFGNKKEYIGRTILFFDITEYKNLLDELNEKNSELVALNEQLEEYASTVEELTITKERNRFARDVHDTLGHTMTLLISLLEVSSITCKNDPITTEEKLSEALKASREGLKELRRSISGLAPEKLQTNTLVSALKELISDFLPSGLHIDFSVDGDEKRITSICKDAIYRVCQEAITNSLRHGRAKNVNIMLKFFDDRIKLFIFDDGCGCGVIKKGFGLSGMEQRIKNIHGSIVYGSDGESGFNIRLEVPIESNVQA